MLKMFAPVLIVLVPTVAFAQPGNDDYVVKESDHMAPVHNALELGVGAGYTQGFGKLGGGMGSVEDVSRAGGALELDVGMRVIKDLSIGLYGTFAQTDTGPNVVGSTDVYGASAGVQVGWHMRPSKIVDPFLNLGSGWRALWLDPSGTTTKTTSLQGVQLARLQFGVDYRITPDIAIAPMISGAVDMFLSENSPMTTDYNEIGNKRVNFEGFAGIAGRFDLGGKR